MKFITPLFMFLTFILFYNKKELKTKKIINQNNKISVVIPARNEEINLPVILSKLKNQTILPHEVIVVDDGSNDNTDKIAISFGVKLIKIDNPPRGWKGKNYACYRGAKAATGNVLLFLDADLILKENAIEKLIGTFKKNTVLSVQPYHYTEKLYEQFSMFFNAIMLAAVGVCLPGKEKSIGLFGPVIMMEKSLYFSSGGHELVKNNVVEDYQFGNLLRQKGIECNMFLGNDSISFQMYKGGFADLIWGWSKNFATGAAKTPIYYLLPVILWITSYYGVAINFIQNSILFLNGVVNFKVFISYVVIYLVAGIILYIKMKDIGNFTFVSCMFYIIPLLVFSLIFAFSIILKFVIKRVKWKGRWHKI